MRKILLLFTMMSSLFAVAQQHTTDGLRQKSLTLRRFLEQNHYQPLQWNDSTSVRLYDRWMELLDAEKLLFSGKEVEQLVVYNARLDDELMGKEWNFFDKTMRLYKSSLLRADSAIRDIMAMPLDFSKADSLAWPLAQYPANGPGIYQTWQKYLKWKVLRNISDVMLDTVKSSNHYSPQPSNFAALEIKAREQIKSQELSGIQNKVSAFDQQNKEMEDNYLSAIGWCYDPHTQYMSADTKTGFETAMSGLEFTTGFEMDENEKGEWVITFLVPGGPAWRNGELHIGDVVLKIKSGDKPELSLADLGAEGLSKIFDGNSNEKMTITVRTVSGKQKTAVFSKEKVTNEEGVVKSYVLKGVKKIGYITLPGFYVKEGDEDNANGCSNDVAKEVVKLKKDSIEGLILDLRYNGGGSLGEALELAGIFISEGSLTSTKDKTGKIRFLKDPNRGTIYDGPLLVMVNTMSASASELVAAVLQDYHRALIVGSPTYGKSSVQVILPMDTTGNLARTAQYESYVKVTHAKFYRVDGSTAQWKGVMPDIELPDMYAMDKFREKGSISALKPDLSKPAIYQRLPEIPKENLKMNSHKRVIADNDFNLITKFATWYSGMDVVRNIPLQWMDYTNYYKKITNMYNSLETDYDVPQTRLTATNNSLDLVSRQLITEHSNSINELNIQRIEKDNYIAESYKIMQDWLRAKMSDE